MSEVAFTKTFLTMLESVPISLASNHTVDPRTYPARPPNVLPKQSQPMRKRQKTVPGSEPSLTVTVRSLRKATHAVKLSTLKPSVSIAELKKLAATNFGGTVTAESIKLLLNKKPVSDGKTLQEVAGDDTEVEFTAMFSGGAVPADPSAAPAAAVDSSTPDAPTAPAYLLNTTEFWDDLQGFLMQRLKNETDAESAFAVFKKAWDRQAKK